MDIAPTVDAGGTFYTCPSAPVMIDATITGGTAPFTYNWDDNTYTIEDPTVTVTQSTVFTLEVTDANGCMQADQATVVTYTADAGSDGDVCEGEGITIGGDPLPGLTIVSSGGTPPVGEHSIEYTWTPNTGLSCDDCPNPTATPAAEETYTLTVTINYPDGTSCQTTDMVDVGIVTAPTELEFAGRDTVLCFGETALLGLTAEGLQGPYYAQATGSSTTSGTLTVSELSDGDFSTGVKTNDGIAENVVLNLGAIYNLNVIDIGLHTSGYWDSDFRVEASTDGINYTPILLDLRYTSTINRISQTAISSLFFPAQDVQYFRFVPESSFRDVGISEFSAKYQPFSYIWTPGDFIAVNGSQATFDAGTLEMPSNNPITYTVTANQGTCNFYDQVTVAITEARADEDGCGPRYLGEEDRTPNLNETYSWVQITDPGITTGTGNFLGATDILHAPVSASTGGDVGYELTVTYTLPSGVMAICKDTVIVPPLCGPGCDVDIFGGGCPDFENGNPGLIGYPPNDDDPSLWTTSWDSNLGMTGLDNYNSQIVYLTDNVSRTYTVTFTSTIDPTYTCTDVIEANSPLYSTPSINAVGGTVCKGDSINIGDPSMNPGLTYTWTNEQFLDDPTNSYPKAAPSSTTEFIITAIDNSTGCLAMDTIEVIVPTAANAGPDLNVCDNGTVTIGANTDTLGFTYSWEPAAAAWEPDSGPTDAMPEVFVATTQDFYLTTVDTSGTCTTRDTVTVTVEPLPAPFMLSPISYCPSQPSLTLGTSDGTAGGTNEVPSGFIYSWSPSTVSDPTAQNPTVNTPLPTTETTYEVTVGTPGGCNQKAEQVITPSISAPIIAGNGTICLGEITPIGDDSNEAGASYVWTSSDTDVSSTLDNAMAMNPVFTPDASGSFKFTVTKTDAMMCSTTAEVTITVNEATAPALSPQTICAGESVQIGVVNNGTLQYQWDPVDGLDDAYISNPTFSGTTSTNYTLTIVDAFGCSAEAYTSVTVNPAPALTITLPDTTICDANTTSLVINAGVAPAGNYAYTWSPTTSLNNPNVLNPIFFIPGAGSYDYVLKVIDQSTGCSIYDTTMMNVTYFAPGSTISANNTTICEGENVILSVSATGTDLTYQWQSSTTDCTTGFANISGATATTYTATGLTEDTYFRSFVFDETGNCVDTSNCVIITVNPTPNGGITPTNETCPDANNGGATAGLTGGTPPFSYLWSTTETTQSISGLSSGNYTVTITDMQGCMDTVTTTITEPDTLKVSIIKTDETCENTNGTATVSSTGGTPTVNFLWEDGETTALITNKTAGTYSVTATDANGCTAIDSITINNVGMDNTGSVTYMGCSGDGYTINVEGTAYHEFNQTGTETITNGNQFGCDSVITINLTFNANPVLTVTDSTICENDSVDLAGLVSATAGTITYHSDTPPMVGNQLASTIVSPTSDSIFYIMTLDGNGCSDTESLTISPNSPDPTFNFVTETSGTDNDTTVCHGGVINFGAAVAFGSGTGALTYEWSATPADSVVFSGSADGLFETGTFSNQGTSPLIVNMKFVVTDANGCKDSIDFDATVQPLLMIDSVQIFDNSGSPQDQGICFGDSIGFKVHNSPPGAYTYAWDSGQTTDSIRVEPPYNNMNTVYNVTVTDAYGCTATTFTSAKGFPEIIASATFKQACSSSDPDTIIYNVSGGVPSIMGYVFDISTEVLNQTSFTPFKVPVSAPAGTVVTTIIDDEKGCGPTFMTTIPAKSYLSATSSVTSENCMDGTGTATATPSGGAGGYTYLWSTSATTQTITSLSAGMYDVTVTDAAGCQLILTDITVTNECADFDLALKKTVAVSGTYKPGTDVDFEIKVYNQGQITATEVVVQDYIPIGLRLNDSNWDTLTTSQIAVDTIASIAPGDSVILNIRLRIGSGFQSATGQLINNAEITSAIGGTDSDSDLSILNDGSTNELATDNDVDDEAAGTPGITDNPADEDDYDAAQIFVDCPPILCLPATVKQNGKE